MLPPRTSQAGGSPPVGCPRLFIQYIRSYPPYWRSFLHPQPKDAPFRGDRDPLITDNLYIELFHQPTLMHNFLYSLTICLLHYYPRHVLSINMSIFRRKNCIHTASGTFAVELSERSYINIRSTVS